jgi:hypothetical protein
MDSEFFKSPNIKKEIRTPMIQGEILSPDVAKTTKFEENHR